MPVTMGSRQNSLGGSAGCYGVAPNELGSRQTSLGWAPALTLSLTLYARARGAGQAAVRRLLRGSSQRDGVAPNQPPGGRSFEVLTASPVRLSSSQLLSAMWWCAPAGTSNLISLRCDPGRSRGMIPAGVQVYGKRGAEAVQAL
jgi:hypothetical protein